MRTATQSCRLLEVLEKTRVLKVGKASAYSDLELQGYNFETQLKGMPYLGLLMSGTFFSSQVPTFMPGNGP